MDAPASAHPLDGAVDRQDLQQQLQRRPAQIHACFQRHSGHGGPRFGERGQDGTGFFLRRHGRGGEVLPDVAVLGTGQQEHVGVGGATAGAADLLVVGHRGRRRPQVHHETEVRLVEAHAQGGRGDEGLDLVVLEELFRAFPVRGVGASGVGEDLVAGFGQEPRGVLGRGDRQGVDDSAAGQVFQVREQPAEPVAGVRQAQHTQPEGLAAQGAADGQHTGAELLLDVVDHPGVGGGSGGQDRDCIRQLGDQVRDAPVVGAEIVAPVGDAVGLIDDQEPGAADQLGQLVLAEGGVGEPLRRDQQDIDLVRRELFADCVPLQLVGGVDGDRPDPGPRRGGHLVTHERQQRGHDQGRPGAAPPEQQGRDEVHGRLSPAGALHHEGAPAAVDEGLNRLELAVMELRGRVPDQLAQDFLGLLPRPRLSGRCGVGSGQDCSVLVIGHCFSIPATSDSREATGAAMWTITAASRQSGG